MRREKVIVTMILAILLFALLLLPKMVFAGDGTLDQITDKINSVTTILSVIFGGGFTIALKLIVDLKKAVKESTEAFLLIKSKVTDPECIKETKEATEALAVVFDDIKLNSYAEKLRKVF